MHKHGTRQRPKQYTTAKIIMHNVSGEKKDTDKQQGPIKEPLDLHHVADPDQPREGCAREK